MTARPLPLFGVLAVLGACASSSSVAAPASWSEREGEPCVVADRPIRTDGLRCFEADHDALPLLSLVQESALVGPGTLATVGTFEGTLVLGPSLTLGAGRPSPFLALTGLDLRPVSGARLDVPGEIVAFSPSCMGSALVTVDEEARGHGPFLTRFANGAITVRRDVGLGQVNVFGAACDAHGEIYLRFGNRTSDHSGNVAKLDAGGTVRWVTKLPTVNGTSVSSDVVVDPFGGAVTIDGKYFEDTAEAAFVTLDPSGRVVARRPGPFGAMNTIVAAPQGYVALSIHIAPNDPPGTFAVAHLDASGAVLWRRVFGNGNGFAYGLPRLAVGPSGEIVVAGPCGYLLDFGDGPHDCRMGGSFVLRLSSDGQRLSSFVLEGAGHDHAYATGLVIAPDGRIYVSGTTNAPKLYSLGRRRGFVLAFR